jgi:branched-subunit amino acid ABC-type transport system permease component
MDTIVAGLGVGCVYAAIALGFGVISYVTGIANFAQGAVAMVGAYVAYSVVGAEAPLAVAVVAALAAGAAAGVVIQLVAVAPLRGERESLTWLLSIIGASLALEGGAGLIYGYDQRVAVTFPHTAGATDVLGVAVPRLYLVLAAALALAVLVVELLFSRRHTLGRSLRAVAADETAATLVGIPSARIHAAAWGFGGLLAAGAGLLAAPLLVLSPNMGSHVGILAIIAAVVGGVGRIGLAPVLGGMILGLVQVEAQSHLGGQWSNVAAVGVLSAVLIVRPQGILPGLHGRMA